MAGDTGMSRKVQLDGVDMVDIPRASTPPAGPSSRSELLRPLDSRPPVLG